MEITARTIFGPPRLPMMLPAALACAWALAGPCPWLATTAAAQSNLCREIPNEPERAICAALGQETQWSLSERAVKNLRYGDEPTRKQIAADIANWGTALAKGCERPPIAPAAALNLPLAEFRPDCRSFLAESLNAYLERLGQAGALPAYRWQIMRGDALENLALSVTPLLDGPDGGGNLAKLQHLVERDAARYLEEAIEQDRRPPGAARAKPCCAQFVEVRALAAWLNDDLVSVENFRRNRTRDGQESGFRYVTLFDPRLNEEIENFTELFAQPKAAIDAVLAILLARFEKRRDIRDYTYYTLENLQKLAADLKRWRLEPDGVTVLFDSGDIAPRTIGFIDEHIGYDAILPFIAKDGPLGRALGLQ